MDYGYSHWPAEKDGKGDAFCSDKSIWDGLSCCCRHVLWDGDSKKDFKKCDDDKSKKDWDSKKCYCDDSKKCWDGDSMRKWDGGHYPSCQKKCRCCCCVYRCCYWCG